MANKRPTFECHFRFIYYLKLVLKVKLTNFVKGCATSQQVLAFLVFPAPI